MFAAAAPSARLPARTSQSPPGNPMDRRTPLVFAAALGTFHLALPETAHAQAQVLDRLSHILVIYMENRSFDNIFGEFPGANGIGQAGESAVQRDRDDKRYEELPVVKGPFHVRANPDELYNAPDIADLPNRPFPIVGMRPGVTPATHTRDLIHAFYTNRSQIHGGKNDYFALFSNAGGLAMGYYGAKDMKDTNLWKLAERGTLFDNFFMGTFGGSFLNHIWLICACIPSWPDPPKSQRSQVDAEGYARAGAARHGRWRRRVCRQHNAVDLPQQWTSGRERLAATAHDDYRRPLDREECRLGLVFGRLESCNQGGANGR